MFLGTSRRWWITSGVLLVLAALLLATGFGGTLGTIAGIVLLLGAVVSFSAAPMRYGRAATKATPQSTASVDAPIPLITTEPPPPRAEIEARDASEV